MHIPDGLLSTPVWATMDVVSVPAVGYLARRAQKEVEESRIPLLGVMGAFVFAAQMINFPVGLGTSGHLLGATLLAVTLGPAAAAVVMTAILAIQALVFQDGGLLALGANVFNMAVLGVLTGYLPYHFLGGGSWRRLSIFLGGVLSVLTGAALAMLQLRLSGVPLTGKLVAVTSALFLVTAGLEGAITLAVVEGVEAISPRWVWQPAGTPAKTLGILSATAVLLAVVGVLFASGAPDGLESLAEKAGIAGNARNLLATPLADYDARFLGSEWPRKAAAGIIGLTVIYIVCIVTGRLLARRRNA
jgi:cobalt/nickel transport system permease protein